MAEHLRVRRHHDVDVRIFAVDADGFRRGRQIISCRLAFFLGAIFRIGLDVPAQQFEQGHRQILAGGHRTPAADGVHTHGDGVLGQQVGVLGTAQREVLDAGIRGLQRLLADFLFRIGRFVAYEIHGQIIEFAVRSTGLHVLNGGDQTFGLQVA